MTARITPLEDRLASAEKAHDDRIRTAERERCAKIAETVEVPVNGHPQIDAPTIEDARRAIAAAIRNQ